MALPPAKNHNHLATDHLCFLLLLSVAVLSSAVSAIDSSLCTIPSPAPEHVAARNDTLPLIHSFRLSAGYFSGGEDIHFARDESGGGDDDDDSMFHFRRSFTLLPLRVYRTTDATVVRVSATLRLSGDRAALVSAAGRRRRDGFAGGAHSVSFHLDGYYSSTSTELCMIGSGTYDEDDDDRLEHLRGVVLRLRVPSQPSHSDPFVTGQLKGDSFGAITLVAYAEGDWYRYGQQATCSPPPPLSTARGAALQELGAALQELGASFSCAHLKEHLVSLYRLQHGGGGVHASSTSLAPPPPRLPEPCMHVGQVQCTPYGAVRVYATFSSSTNMFFAGQLRPGFMVREAAVKERVL